MPRYMLFLGTMSDPAPGVQTTLTGRVVTADSPEMAVRDYAGTSPGSFRGGEISYLELPAVVPNYTVRIETPEPEVVLYQEGKPVGAKATRGRRRRA